MQYLQNFANFEKKLHQLELPIDLDKQYTKRKISVIFSVAIATCLIVAYVFIDIILFLGSVTFADVGAEVVTYVFPLVSMMIMVLQFCTLCYFIRENFELINLKLKQIKQKWHKRKSTKSSKKVKTVLPM